MNCSQRKPGGLDRKYIIRYTILFLGLSFVVFFPFILTGRSLVKKIDGMSQYIVYLRYMGQYLRSAVRGILHGSFSLPSYDFSIGMGDDIGQIVRFHPFDFLSVFVPAAYTEILYEAILILRFYAAGLAFSIFAFGRRENMAQINVLSGSVVYVFCGFMLIRVVNHPTYAAPFIVLPLLLLGAERMMLGRGCALFIFSVFAGFWSNYYFMYIMSAALLVYVLVRFPEVFEKNRVRCFFSLLWKMCCAYLLGLLMSMMTLLPMLMRYLASARSSQNTEGMSYLLYADKRRYIAWFVNMISPYQSSGNGTDLNFTVTVLPALAVLSGLAWRQYRTLKKLLIACLLVLLIPAAGYVLAFFNRENNRWVFVLAMCCAMSVTLTADCFAQLSRRQKILLLCVSGVFLVLVLGQTILTGMNPYNLAAAAELVICLAVLLSSWVRAGGLKRVRRCVLLITCASTAVNGFMTYMPGYGALTKQYVKAGKTMRIYDKFFRSVGASLIEDDSFYRIEGFNVKHGRENSSIYSDYNSTSEYNSILNTGMMDAMMSQNNLGLNAITTMRGLDARPVSLNLAYVRYFALKAAQDGCVPYGFSKEPAAADSKVKVYKCENPLAFGYSCRSFITRENYDRLEPLEREMVQLEAVVVQKASGNETDPAKVLKSAGFAEITKPDIEISAADVSLPKTGEGLTCSDGVVHASRRSSMSFSWEERAGYDAYLLLSALEAPGEEANLLLSTRGFVSTVNVRGSEQLYNTGREDYLVHLGYSDSDNVQSASLTFKRAGDYQLAGAKILYVPMEDFNDRIDDLNSSRLENEKVEDGHIEGTVNFDSPGILVLSVPQADGWTLEVDGDTVHPGDYDETGILPLTANVFYQGIMLPEGSHTISLTYSTPGSAAGAAAAVPAIIVFLVLLFFERRNRLRRREDA